MTKDRKARMDDLAGGAVEAEADEGRHDLEEAILATVAAAGPGHPFAWKVLGTIASGQSIFSRSDFRAIAYALAMVLLEKNLPADAVIIGDELKKTKAKVDAVVLRGILSGKKAVDIAVAEQYAAKLAALDRYRQAESLGHSYLKMVDQAKADGRDPDAAFGNLAKGVFDQAQSKKLVADHPVEAAVMPDFMADLEARRTDGRDYVGLRSGIRHLDEVLNGLGTGLFIFGGMPSSGKTSLLKQIADHVAEVEKVAVLFYTFEQSAEELRIKSLSRLAQVNSREIWKGRSDAAKWERVQAAAESYGKGAGQHLRVVEADRETTVDRIRAAALMAKHRAGDRPVLVIIDYLQIIPADGKFNSIREQVDYHLSELRRLARDIQSPVVVISSLNRASYSDPTKPPNLTVLKESGGIEFSADVVVCLWRDNDESERMTRENDRETVRVELHVLKNRNGELKKVKLNFTPAWADFGLDPTSYSDRIKYTAAQGYK